MSFCVLNLCFGYRQKSWSFFRSNPQQHLAPLQDLFTPSCRPLRRRPIGSCRTWEWTCVVSGFLPQTRERSSSHDVTFFHALWAKMTNQNFMAQLLVASVCTSGLESSRCFTVAVACCCLLSALWSQLLPKVPLPPWLSVGDCSPPSRSTSPRRGAPSPRSPSPRSPSPGRSPRSPQDRRAAWKQCH